MSAGRPQKSPMRDPATALRFVSALVVGLVLSAATPAVAQDNGARVADILVEAPAPLLESARAAIVVRRGATFDVADLHRSIQNIYALGRVSDVHVEEEETDAGAILRFTVLPAARLAAFRFEGARPVRRGALEDALTATPGDRITRALIEEQAARVQGVLSDRGYLAARVEPELVLEEEGLDGTLTFHLYPGEATVLSRLDFVGDLGIPESVVRQAFGLTEGGVFRYDQLGAGIERLRQQLATSYYFHAVVEIEDQATNQSENTADLVVRIDAGPRVDLQFLGWDRGPEELREMLPFFEAASVGDWVLKQARSDVIAELQAQGYWKPLVSYGRVRDAAGRNVEVNFTVAPVRRTRVEVVEMRGNDAFPDEVLLELLSTRESSLMNASRFLSTDWEQDQRDLLQFYRRNGYLQARIVDAPVTYEAAIDGLRAAIEIEEGEQTTVGAPRIDVPSSPSNSLSDYGIETDDWLDELATAGGGAYDPDAVRQDETRLRILLANLGFQRAQVASEVAEGADPLVVDVVFAVRPGRRSRVGQVLISGNEHVRDEVIRRQLTLVPGSPFTQESVIVSQSRLYRLGIFSRVAITTAQPDTIAADPTVVVRVTEGSSTRLSWGIGYSTEEQVRGLFILGRDNLWERNHRATVSTRASFAEQRVRFVYTNPYLFGRELEGSAVGFFESVDEEGFKVQRIGTALQFVKRHTDWLTSIGRYSFRDQQTFDVLIDEDELEPEDRAVVVGSLIYSLLADTRPDPIEPRSGGYHTLDAEWAARPFGSESNFVKLFGRSYWYWGGPGDTVLVGAVRAGLALPYGDSIVPLPERFFAGGSTTLRGFGRNLAGPTDDDGNPLGGNVLLIGNLEYRFPVRGNLGAVMFVDVGNVFAEPDTVSMDNVRETLGLGVRYATPIGPLRLDWGYLIDARPGEDPNRFHFAIGQAF